jgi:regulatory protein YycH of two-component signal transduction system YycFG
MGWGHGIRGLKKNVIKVSISDLSIAQALFYDSGIVSLYSQAKPQMYDLA